MTRARSQQICCQDTPYYTVSLEWLESLPLRL